MVNRVRPLLLTAAILVVAAMFPSAAGIAGDGNTSQYAAVEITQTYVAGQVHMLQGAGGNIAVQVGKDGLVLIDDQFAPLSEKIQTVLDGFEAGRVKFLLNTHWHGDHTGGNAHFGSNASIIAHANVRKRLSTDQFIEFFNKTIEAQPEVALPVITFEDTLSIHFNGEEIHVRHFPNGHTDGDAVIFFKGSKVIHMGDLFFNGRFPFIDLGSQGTVDGYIANVKKVLSMIDDDVKIIPGHGALAGKSDLAAFSKMLIETVALIRAKQKERADTEELRPTELLADWSDWGSGFISPDAWVKLVTNET